MSKTDFTQINLLQSVSDLWGIEFADERSFFSLTGKSQFVSSVEKILEKTDRTLFSKQFIQLTNGQGFLTRNEIVSTEQIERMHQFEACSETYLLDFVSRYVFPKEWFDYAVIHGERVEHHNQNIYYQFPLDEAHDTIQFIGLKKIVQIRVTSLSAPSSFVPYLYVRDEPGFWIAHIRFLPSSDEKVITKLNYSFYNRAIPPVLNFLLRIMGLQHRFLYRGEKKKVWSWVKKQFYRFLPLTSYRLGKIGVGERIEITSFCSLDSNEVSD